METSFNNGAGNETIARNGEWYKLLKHLSKYNCPDVYVFQEKKKHMKCLEFYLSHTIFCQY